MAAAAAAAPTTVAPPSAAESSNGGFAGFQTERGKRVEVSEEALAKAVRTRGQHRAARKRADYRVVALVGYTNAGKSTLFNRLTGAGVMAKDMLSATLDPTMRAVEIGAGLDPSGPELLAFRQPVRLGQAAGGRGREENPVCHRRLPLAGRSASPCGRA